MAVILVIRVGKRAGTLLVSDANVSLKVDFHT